MAISFSFGPLAIAIGAVASNIIAVFINTVPLKRLINYSYVDQIKDCFNSIIPLTLMAASVIAASFLPIPELWLLIVEIIVGIISYVLTSAITKCEPFLFLLNFVTKRFSKKAEQTK